MASTANFIKGKNQRESIERFLHDLLKEKKVDAVLVPKRHPGGNIVSHVLITDPSKTEGIDPLAPVQMVNAACIVKELSKEPVDKKITVILRPCEVRATIELIKLKQLSDESLYIIGYDCPGVYNVKEYMSIIENVEDKEAFTQKHMEDFLSGDKESMREVCRFCTSFTADSADINIAWIGLGPSGIVIEARSEKGRQIANDLKVEEEGDLAARREKIETIATARKKRQKSGIENLLDLIQPCIRCYNCREVCPLCYCKECLLEPEKLGYSSERYLNRAAKKDQIKMPVDTLLYHLTKINHMGYSCVSCGLCEQACPMDIPLGTIYNVFSKKIQALFDYVPGKSRDDELPLTTFREEELSEVEDR
ncbi:MAG TPA: Coenzyme F420 hydrogenase/dehydrogenase, beta subunit C-terminal domain [Spirochaetota bacterium]|nr:Coenzyme F420 hydrogenase/dehydrogenase, beta subunit C-terminal domain [Spirochaetota bacterium]